MITRAVTVPRGGQRTLALRLNGRICLPVSAPKRFNVLFRQHAAVSLLRHHVAILGSHGILTVSAIGLAARLSLRTRLTGMTSIARETLALWRTGISPV